MKLLITAGPTREPIDPVRFISNRSSGKMGYSIASAALKRGHSVILISGPVALKPPKGAHSVNVITAADMLTAVRKNIKKCDVLVMAAAVSDFRPAICAAKKLKKSAVSSFFARKPCDPACNLAAADSIAGRLSQEGMMHLASQDSAKISRGPGCNPSTDGRSIAGRLPRDASLSLPLKLNPDILKAVASAKGKRIFVGFAAETGRLRPEALRKLREKNLDLIVANDVSRPDAGFETDTNRVTLFSAGGKHEELPLMTKEKIAGLIIKWIEAKQRRQPRANLLKS